MEQEFAYPNLLNWKYSREFPWFEPRPGVKNTGRSFVFVDFGRPLAAGDVLRVSFALVFDQLDLSDPGAQFYMQGPLRGTQNEWRGSALFGDDIHRHAGGQVLDGEERVATGCTVKAGGPVEGATGQYFGVRVDYAGGASPRASAHGHAQRAGRAARMGAGCWGGVAVGE